MLDNKGFDRWADGYDKAVILDIGFGTGTLTTKLYENGCEIYGQDFSSRMIEQASEKMPGAHLFLGAALGHESDSRSSRCDSKLFDP